MKDQKDQEKMPLINAHASYLKQDKQWLAQRRWLKKHGFKTVREALDAGK